MTRYEALREEQRALRHRRAFAITVLTLAALAGIVAVFPAVRGSPIRALVGALLAPFALDRVMRLVVVPYRRWAIRSDAIAREIAAARRRMASVFGRLRERRKGERFKSAYVLAGRSTRELEEALSIGMHREGREVFVTAFMRSGTALRVTASIGSPFRCSAADDPARWKGHVDRLGCDEVRQYHNHPVHGGSTRPSSADIRSSGRLRRLLDPHAELLRSYVICWNGIREWKVVGYDHRGRHWLEHEYDVLDGQPD